MRHALADRDQAGGLVHDPIPAVATAATAHLSTPGLIPGPGCARSAPLRRLGAAVLAARGPA